MSERPERVTLSTDIFEALFMAVEGLPANRAVRQLLNAAEADVKPYEAPST